MISIKIFGQDLITAVVKKMQHQIHKMRESIYLEGMIGVPEGTFLISQGEDDDWGCREERWRIFTLEAIIGIDERGDGNMFVLAGDWESEFVFSDVEGMDDLRQRMFDTFNEKYGEVQ